MLAFWLGRVEYGAAWDLQKELADLRAGGLVGDTLLLLEHPPTITLGRAADTANILATSERLERMGIAVHQIDRGGDVTYHGPGQLIGYPIFHLGEQGRDLHAFLRNTEEALIQALDSLGVRGRRFPPHTGVWVDDRKVAAIGIKVSRWVSTHGFALNVEHALDHFELIVPCGIRGYGVTSVSAEAGRLVQVEEPIRQVVRAFRQVFEVADDRWDPAIPLSESSRGIMRKAVEVAETDSHHAAVRR